MQVQRKDSLRKLIRDGSIHIDTYRADGTMLALRTALTLDGDLVTKIDPQHVTPKLLDRHNRQVQQTLAPIQNVLLWIGRLLGVVEHRYFFVGGISLAGTTMGTLLTEQVHNLTWRGIAYRLVGSGAVTMVLAPLWRKSIQLLIQRTLARAMGPTGTAS